MTIGAYQEAAPRLFTQGLYDESSVALQRIGTVRALDDGRVFVYARNGAATLATCKLNQTAVNAADHKECVVSDTAIGASRIYLTLNGSTAAAANLFKDGYLYINKNTGVGQLLKIRGHAAITGGGAGYIELYDQLRIATASSAEASLLKHPQDGVVVCPTTLTGAATGVNPIAVTASYYFWNQVKGPCTVLAEGTWVITGGALIASASAGGALAPQGETAIMCTFGQVLVVPTTAEYGICMLDIPGY